VSIARRAALPAAYGTSQKLPQRAAVARAIGRACLGVAGWGAMAGAEPCRGNPARSSPIELAPTPPRELGLPENCSHQGIGPTRELAPTGELAPAG